MLAIVHICFGPSPTDSTYLSDTFGDEIVFIAILPIVVVFLYATYLTFKNKKQQKLNKYMD